MVSKTKITFGTLFIILFATSILISLDDVRLRVFEDYTTFYVPHEDYSWIWTVSGREYNRLFDGTSLMNRRKSGITIRNYTIGSNYFIERFTPYIRGPVIIDTYEFNSKIDDVKLFPVKHTVEVFNASGYFYRYSVDDLNDVGPKRKLTGETSLSFGKNMKVDLHPGYRWAWIGYPYGSDSLAAQYNIPSDYEVFNVRLFDPIANATYELNNDVTDSIGDNDGVNSGVTFSTTIFPLYNISGNGSTHSGYWSVGETDQINITEVVTGTNQFTISMWVFFNASSCADRLFGQGGGNNDRSIDFGRQSGDCAMTAAYSTSAGGSFEQGVTGSIPTLGEWQMWSIVRNGTDLDLYLNGTRDANKSSDQQ